MRAIGLRHYAPEQASADATTLVARVHLNIVHNEPFALAAGLQRADRVTGELDDRAAGDVERLIEAPILVDLVPTPDRFHPTSIAGVMEGPEEFAIRQCGWAQGEGASPRQQVAPFGLHLAAEWLAAEVPLNGQACLLQQAPHLGGVVESEVERDLNAPHVVDMEDTVARVKRDQRDAILGEHPAELHKAVRELV